MCISLYLWWAASCTGETSAMAGFTQSPTYSRSATARARSKPHQERSRFMRSRLPVKPEEIREAGARDKAKREKRILRIPPPLGPDETFLFSFTSPQRYDSSSLSLFIFLFAPLFIPALFFSTVTARRFTRHRVLIGFFVARHRKLIRMDDRIHLRMLPKRVEPQRSSHTPPLTIDTDKTLARGKCNPTATASRSINCTTLCCCCATAVPFVNHLRYISCCIHCMVYRERKMNLTVLLRMFFSADCGETICQIAVYAN